MISTSPGGQSFLISNSNSNSTANSNGGSILNGNFTITTTTTITSNSFKGHNRSNHSNGSINTSGNYFEAPLFQEGFGSFLKSGEFSDLTVHSEGKVFHLHRVILAHSSKYFSDFFDLENKSTTTTTSSPSSPSSVITPSSTIPIPSSANNNSSNYPVTLSTTPTSESTLESSFSYSDDNSTYFVKIDNQNYELKGQFIEHFDMVVNYMYEGRVNLTPKNALPLLSLSNCFQIKGLKKYATFYLTSSITKENAFFMLNKAIHIKSEDLITKCITVICKHFNQMIQPHFSHVFTQPQFIHSSSTLNTTHSNTNTTNNYSEELDSLVTGDHFTNLESSLNNNSSEPTNSTNSDSDDSDLDSFSSSTTHHHQQHHHHHQHHSTATTNITSSSLNIPTTSSSSSFVPPQSSNPIGISSRFGSPVTNSILSSSMANDKSLSISTIHTIPELLSLPVSIMIRLMRQNNLSVSNEAVVYKTIVKYIQANKATLSEQDIETLFECVRFPLFNYQQLEEVQDNTLVPKSLITEALMMRLRLHEGPKDMSNLSLSPSSQVLQTNSKSPTSSSLNVQYTPSSGSVLQFTPSVIITSTNNNNNTSSTTTTTSSSFSSLNVNSTTTPSNINNNTSINSDSLIGSTILMDASTDSSAIIRRTPRAPFAISLEYNSEMKGVFYYIGTNGLKDEWSNPANRGRVRVTSSSIEKGNVTDVVGRQPTECWTMDVPASWIAINLGSSRTMVPTFYTLRHGGNSKADCLRNWTLQGSMDSKNWTILSRHSNDSSLNGNYSTWTWPIENCTQAYRHFRILQTGRNSTNHNFLSLSGIEFYGDLYETRKDD